MIQSFCRTCGAAFTKSGRRNVHCSDSCRFWPMVAKGEAGACWNFLGAINKDGYGRFKIRGRMQQAHRVAYRLSIGEAGSLDVLHTCDNKSCCNPAHHYLGTDVENAKDRVDRGRAARGASTNGRGITKLADEDILRIRRLRLNGSAAASIAAMFSISSATVYRICNGSTWKHI